MCVNIHALSSHVCFEARAGCRNGPHGSAWVSLADACRQGVTGFFTAPADASPFTYRVRSIGDGRGFVVRAVEASQKGVICFTCTCGFKRKDQDGIRYQADCNTAGAPGELVGARKPWEHRRRWGIQVPG